MRAFGHLSETGIPYVHDGYIFMVALPRPQSMKIDPIHSPDIQDSKYGIA